jgi:hypothetical protein
MADFVEPPFASTPPESTETRVTSPGAARTWNAPPGWEPTNMDNSVSMRMPREVVFKNLVSIILSFPMKDGQLRMQRNRYCF